MAFVDLWPNITRCEPRELRKIECDFRNEVSGMLRDKWTVPDGICLVSFRASNGGCGVRVNLYCAAVEPTTRATRPYSYEFNVSDLNENIASLIKRYVNERCGGKDSNLYRAAGVKRGTYHAFMTVTASRKRTPRLPSKVTLIQLAFALRLSLDELNELLLHAGYALSPSIPFDKEMRYLFENEIYDLIDVNAHLEGKGFKPFSLDEYCPMKPRRQSCR